MLEARPSIITRMVGFPSLHTAFSNSSCLPGKSRLVRERSSRTVTSLPPNTIITTSADFAASIASSIICCSLGVISKGRTSLSGKCGSTISHPFLYTTLALGRASLIPLYTVLIGALEGP